MMLGMGATHELMLADIQHAFPITGSEYLNGVILTPQQLWDPPPSAYDCDFFTTALPGR